MIDSFDNGSELEQGSNVENTEERGYSISLKID